VLMLTDGGMHVTCMAAATESACIAQSYQGSHFRRNFGEIPEKISFPLVTGKRNFAIFR